MSICFLFIFTGCWGKIEVSDLAIITAAAVDQVEEDKIKVSVQLFIPRAISSGETGEDPSQGSTFVREATGDNLAQAVSKLQNNVPRKLFWGQCKLIIFGEKLAENGIRKEIDFLVRYPSPRGRTLMYVSQGEAKEILTLAPPLERYSSDALIKLTVEEKGMKTTLMDVDMALMGESKSVSMPYIKKLEPKEPQRKSHETIPIIIGSAVFSEDKLVGTLNMMETRGLLWLKDEVKGSTISIKLEDENEEEGGYITMTPTIGRIKYSPKINDDGWIMNLSIDIEGDIVQNETKLNLMNEDIINKLRSEFEAELILRVNQTLEKLQQEYKADVIHFAKRFHQKYPRDWHEVKDNWNERFAEVVVNMNVHATIRRPGYIGPPAALPFDEVEEVVNE